MFFVQSASCEIRVADFEQHRCRSLTLRKLKQFANQLARDAMAEEFDGDRYVFDLPLALDRMRKRNRKAAPLSQPLEQHRSPPTCCIDRESNGLRRVFLSPWQE